MFTTLLNPPCRPRKGGAETLWTGPQASLLTLSWVAYLRPGKALEAQPCDVVGIIARRAGLVNGLSLLVPVP
jgi:hypothetical protein